MYTFQLVKQDVVTTYFGENGEVLENPSTCKKIALVLNGLFETKETLTVIDTWEVKKKNDAQKMFDDWAKLRHYNVHNSEYYVSNYFIREVY